MLATFADMIKAMTLFAWIREVRNSYRGQPECGQSRPRIEVAALLFLESALLKQIETSRALPPIGGTLMLTNRS